jgi:endonuclease YncB( thermonuclease family)
MSGAQQCPLAAINAREVDGSCNHEPCPAMRHEQAQPIVARMVLGKTLTCRIVGKSYKRLVGDCRLPDGRGLSCAIIRSGAALRWDSFWWRENMGLCR